MIRIGQRLHDQRIRKGFTLKDVAKATKIRFEFLSAIENGEYDKLPSSAYALGFVKNYAEFLELPVKEMLPLFRREFDAKKDTRVLPQGLPRSKNSFFGHMLIRRNGLLITLVFIILLGYILFQYRAAFVNPSLVLFAPRESVVTSTSVTVSGKTEPNVTVYINEHLVNVDQNGSFRKSIDLFPGETTITVKAVNRFGKETIVERHIEVK